jgi:hypothetical protein
MDLVILLEQNVKIISRNKLAISKILKVGLKQQITAMKN